MGLLSAVYAASKQKRCFTLGNVVTNGPVCWGTFTNEERVMADLDVEVLQARLDGLQEAFLVMGALLNKQGVLSSQVLQAKIRSRIEDLKEPHPVAMEQMNHLADQLPELLP